MSRQEDWTHWHLWAAIRPRGRVVLGGCRGHPVLSRITCRPLLLCSLKQLSFDVEWTRAGRGKRWQRRWLPFYPLSAEPSRELRPAPRFLHVSPLWSAHQPVHDGFPAAVWLWSWERSEAESHRGLSQTLKSCTRVIGSLRLSLDPWVEDISFFCAIWSDQGQGFPVVEFKSVFLIGK